MLSDCYPEKHRLYLVVSPHDRFLDTLYQIRSLWPFPEDLHYSEKTQTFSVPDSAENRQKTVGTFPEAETYLRYHEAQADLPF